MNRYGKSCFENCRVSVYNKGRMNRQINWNDLELHKRFPEKWYKTMQGVRQVASLMGVKDESEVQRILFAAQREAKRRGRVEISVRSGL